jgi:peptidoglycan LD-endopeptidase CwlK
MHTGALVVHHALAREAIQLFTFMTEVRFPIEHIVPASQFEFDDIRMMQANNTSAFNYRTIEGTDTLSVHATGCAIDINPRLNPMILRGVTYPPDAQYIPGQPGVLDANHPVVCAFRKLGWTWGGDWDEPIDYHHFEKHVR